MTRQVVKTDQAPKAVAAYSQAIIANGFVFCAGQIAIDPATGKLIEGDVTAQTEQVFKNIKAVLAAAGTDLSKVVKANVYLHNMADFAAMNAVYATMFTHEPPARTTVGNLVLPLGGLVEIEVTALA
jgi:2-iminobutanoate/2-iminopropanoate deaminase